jgi:ABC-type multidrug transport system fused ATPase/permease subunit
LAALEKLFAGRTILIIAHKLSTIPRHAKIAVMSQGQLVEEGSHEELVARGGLYRRLYDLQESHIIKPL